MGAAAAGPLARPGLTPDALCAARSRGGNAAGDAPGPRGGARREAPRRAAVPAALRQRPARTTSVADIDLRGDSFQFRKGTDARFSGPAARAQGRRRRGEEDEADEADGAAQPWGLAPGAVLPGDDDDEAEGGAPARARARPTRGTAEARMALTTPLPLAHEELRERRAARWAAEARAAGPRAAGEEDDAPDAGAAEEEDEDLREFRPRVLTRAAAAADADAFFSPTHASWAQLGASAELQAALSAAGAARPSGIQARAWAALAPGAPTAAASPHVLLADAAGAGKTLAYLAPLVAALRAAEAAGVARAAARSPHVVVLVPTAELAAQVLAVARALSRGGAPFRAAAATGGRAGRTQAATLAGGVELLIGTPGRLAALAAEGALSLRDVRCLVLDEADVLAGPHGDFEAAVAPLRDGCPRGARTVLVTATLPADAEAHLRQRLLGGAPCAAVLGARLHRPAAGIEEQLVDCSGAGGAEGDGAPTWRQGFRRKAEALARCLAAAPRAPTLVFCNTLDSCRAVENFLKRRDRRGTRYDVHAVHAAVDAAARDAAFAALAAPPPPPSEPPPVVVATDRASRGLDCAGVRHVILFDFPRDASEYVRRVGRTARGAGGTGRATLLVLGRQVALAREIMARNARGAPLEALPSEGGAAGAR